MSLLHYRRTILEAIYIAAEAIAWFIVLAVLATMVERSFYSSLAERIQLGLGVGDFGDTGAAEVVLEQLRVAADHAEAGPSVLVVLAAAAGGFALMRLVPRLDLGPGISSAVLVAATIVAINVLLHVSMGDLRVWDASRIITMLNDPTSQIAGSIDLPAFVADPDLEGPHVGALSVTFVGLTVVWFRFMLAARASVGMERITLSFTT
ncbi:MAG: hypothetical protein KC458_11625, partial [Dehalococcoidia bacterium]|nr:hypothetical protein [Dehalococcoidia bacterium]